MEWLNRMSLFHFYKYTQATGIRRRGTEANIEVVDEYLAEKNSLQVIPIVMSFNY